MSWSMIARALKRQRDGHQARGAKVFGRIASPRKLKELEPRRRLPRAAFTLGQKAGVGTSLTDGLVSSTNIRDPRCSGFIFRAWARGAMSPIRHVAGVYFADDPRPPGRARTARGPHRNERRCRGRPRCPRQGGGYHACRERRLCRREALLRAPRSCADARGIIRPGASRADEPLKCAARFWPSVVTRPNNGRFSRRKNRPPAAGAARRRDSAQASRDPLEGDAGTPMADPYDPRV